MRTTRSYVWLAVTAWMAAVNVGIHAAHTCGSDCRSSSVSGAFQPPASACGVFHGFDAVAAWPICDARAPRHCSGCRDLRGHVPPAVPVRHKVGCRACKFLELAQNTTLPNPLVLVIPHHREVAVYAREITPVHSGGYSPSVPRAPPVLPA